MKVELEEEYKVYLDGYKSWTKEHLGEYVLIKANKIINFFKSYDEALECGLKTFGNIPFFIKVVNQQEEVHFFHQGIK